jgi:hypothetical protein
MGWSCSTNGEKRNVNRLLVGKPKRKRSLRRLRCRWLDIINTNLEEVGWMGIHWIGLWQDRDKRRALVNAVMNLCIPLSAGRLLSGCTTGGLLSSVQLHGVSYERIEFHGLHKT